MFQLRACKAYELDDSHQCIRCGSHSEQILVSSPGKLQEALETRFYQLIDTLCVSDCSTV